MIKLLFGRRVVRAQARNHAVFCLVFILCAGSLRAQNERDYEIQANDTGITILRYKGVQRTIEIPGVILDKQVTVIADKAFYMKQLSSVIIPEGVTHIGPDAFKSNRLTEVTIPASVTFIGGGAFASNQLSSASLPAGLKYIASGAFANNKLADTAIPDGVVVIGIQAFANNLLSNIQIPEGTVYIGGKAFESNPIKQIVLPESVLYIGGGAFDFLTSTAGISSLSVQIGSNVEISAENDHGSYSRAFPFYFEKFYRDNGRQGGSYTYENSRWKFNE